MAAIVMSLCFIVIADPGMKGFQISASRSIHSIEIIFRRRKMTREFVDRLRRDDDDAAQ